MSVESDAIEFLASPLSRFRPWRTPEGRSPQAEFFAAAADFRYRILRGGNRIGKGLQLDEPVFTPEGWRTAGEIRVGDLLVSGRGKPTRVTGVFPQGEQPTYRFTFTDASYVVCDASHRWKVKDRNGRFAPDPSRHSDPDAFGRWKVMSAGEILERWGADPSPPYRVSIPVTAPLDLPERDLPLAPYLLGCLLGDGCLVQSVRLTSADPELVDRCRAVLPPGHALERSGESIDYALVGPGDRDRSGHAINYATDALRGLGLLGKRSWEKSVPPAYLLGSTEQRLELLRGLLDTDGSCAEGGAVEYSTTSPDLADAVRFLVQSLGGTSRVRSRTTSYRCRGEVRRGRLSYRVSARIPGLNPFALARKAERYNTAVAWTYERILESIRPEGLAETVCFTVDDEDHTFLARDLVVTHNSESGVVDVLLRCFGWHRFAARKPPVRGWVVCVDWDAVGSVIWPKFKKYISMDRVKVGWQRRTGVEIPESVKFPNGSEIIFKSAESQREKFQGADLDFAWIDEEIDGTIVEEIEARLLDRRGDLLVTLTPVTRKAWVSALERKVEEGRPLTKVVRASMRDAAASGIIDRRSVETYLDGLPDRQRRVRELGDYASLEGLVYPEYAEHTHVVRPRGGQLWDGEGRAVAPWPLPRTWPRFGGIDFGYAVPTAVPILSEDPATGRIYAERCYYASSVRISRWADVLKEVLPALAMPLVADHQAFERAEIQGCGIQTVPAKKDVWPGLETVERYLSVRGDGRPGIQFVVDDVSPPKHPVVGRYDCQALVWELANYRYREKDPKDKHTNVGRDLPVKKDDHAMDALRYILAALERRGGAEAPTVAAPPNPYGDVSDLLRPRPPPR